MFYREYRPQKFSEIVGSEQIVSAITSALAKGNPSHAYFFTGQRGVGKTSIARILAKSLSCQNPVKLTKSPIYFEPCNECDYCKQIQNGNFLDLIEIDAASNRGIDDIRELRENVKLAPSKGKNKIYIIDEVHMLTNEASNALLKTLEEPPEHSYFILCTTNPEKVLDTIKSRCQKFQFTRPTIEDIKNKLKLIAKDKNYKIDDDKLTQIATLARGAYREGETILEQIINGDDYIDKYFMNEDTTYASFVGLININDAKNSVLHVHKIYESGINIELWTEKLVEYLRILLLAQLNVTNEDLTQDEINLSKKLSIDNLTTYINTFTESLTKFKTAIIPTLPLELAIVELCSLNVKNAPNNEKTNPIVSPTKDNKDVTSKPLTINNIVKKELSQDVKKMNEELKPNKIIDKEKTPKTMKIVEFPYKKLIDEVKPMNHSIHLLLHSCKVVNFDGTNLNLQAQYSFHKERLMSVKIKTIVEDAAARIMGEKIVVHCEFLPGNKTAARLTDLNIKNPSNKLDIDQVFEQVFGDEVEVQQT